MDMTEFEIRRDAATALEDGRQLAALVASRRKVTGAQRGRMCMEALGSSLANPAEFWAGACYLEGVENGTADGGNTSTIEHSLKLAAARMAAGNFEFVRESLVGQAQWASVLAVKLAIRAEMEDKPDKVSLLMKLAMQAQRQAAQALATAAALNKLVDDCTVGVVSG